MRRGKPFLNLQTTIILLVGVVLMLALYVTDFLISERMAETIQKSEAEKTTYVARMVANSALVIEGLTGKRDEREIQPFANRIKHVTEVDFVVVMDMNGIRKSHPDPSKVGKRFVGGDEGHVLQGNEHVSIARGTLGLSLRSFTPIYGPDGEQVGAAAVGILLVNVNETIAESRMIIFFGIGIGGLVGLFGSFLLARKIKRILFGLEPFEIAKLLEERNAMLQSAREGILAVDQNACITLANAEAIRLLHQAGIEGDPIGKNVEEFLPNSRLGVVLETGEAELDQEQDLSGMTILVNRVPVSIKGEIVGAIATFRDKTEIRQLAEQLTGVQLYAEALRAQTHEFMNKLQVILGMIHMGFYDKLAVYISEIANHQQQEVGSIVRQIKDPVLAGFILGKLSYAREVDAALTISGESILPEPENPEVTHDLITIIGNLVDNAMQAVQGCPQKGVDLSFYYEEGLLTIEVTDTGPGLSEEQKKLILTKGYSTKGDNRGIGLFLVQRSVQRLNGTLHIASEVGSGTRFTVDLPYTEKEGEEDDD